MNLPALEKLETMLLVSLDSHDPGSSKQSISESKYMTEFLSFFCRVYWTALTSESSGMQIRGTNPSTKARSHSSAARTNGGYLSHVCQTLACLIACTVNCSRRETKRARSTRWPWRSTAVSYLKCKFHRHTWRLFQRYYVNCIIWSSQTVSPNSHSAKKLHLLPLFFFNRSRQVKLLVCTLIEKMKYRKKKLTNTTDHHHTNHPFAPFW